jgi:[acyl-carrier-protein] S-malonyltransferase
LTETMKVAYVFPGQGSQLVGMGLDLYQGYDSARAVFEQADKALSFPISKLCFEGPEEELVQTVNAQPAIVTASFACLEAARSLNLGLPSASFVAGHSLGEYAALAAAGVLDFPTAVYLARERGRLMHEAGELTPGGMAAIIGLEESLLAEVCQQSGARIANINCPGQIVISGAKDKLARAMEMAKERGAYRVIPLQVSGAFHTKLMQPAVDGMTQVMTNLKFNSPTVPIIGNTSAKPLTTAGAVKEELLAQLCNCVQWQRSIEYMINDGVSTFMEIGPGRVLAGLIKRIDRGVKIINIGDAEAIKNIAQGVR